VQGGSILDAKGGRDWMRFDTPNNAHQSIDALRGDRVLQSAGAVVADRPEQRAGLVEAMPGSVEIGLVTAKLCILAIGALRPD
jgi:hypothetical protein